MKVIKKQKKLIIYLLKIRIINLLIKSELLIGYKILY